MLNELHFLRPWWWLAFLPLCLLAYLLLRHVPELQAWKNVCDPHLLPHLMQIEHRRKRWLPLILLLTSMGFIIISLTGPTWTRLPVPTYHAIQPRVVLLDMSADMKATDLSPNRLSRAKFKLHDLLQFPDIGQLGLVVYTDDAFVVSPLTDDGQTIDALITALTPDIMPVQGNRLERALQQGADLLKQAGATTGQMLVLTAQVPSAAAVDTARRLGQQGIHISVLPILADPQAPALFMPLAEAGFGRVISYTDTAADIEQWLSTKYRSRYSANINRDVALWRDEGRWFIIPALLFLLPVFRRGWLQRINS